MPPLPYDRFCDEVVAQAGLLRELLAGADLSVTVPTTPDWTLAQLLRHIGGNLRALETAVRTGAAVTEPEGQVPDHGGPPGDDPAALDAWLAASAAGSAETLRRAGPEVQAQVWTVRWPTALWARRAAHDLVVHRADAAGAVGAPYTVAPDLAADAIDEFLDLLSNLRAAGPGDQGEAVGPGAEDPATAGADGPEGTVHLHATGGDPGQGLEWLVELTPPSFTWRRAHERADVAVRGPLPDLLRVVTRRLPPSADGVEVLGDRALLDAWLDRLVLR
jgi:uncharacterized protein (TIGR03083 family)